MKRVDINVDIGEGFGFDEALLDFATSANVCLGAHAGSEELTAHTFWLCERKGVRVGLHPGFLDRESMGRAMPDADDLGWYAENIFNQVEQWLTVGAEYVKPHGAWYNLLTSGGPLYTGSKLILDGVLAMSRGALQPMLLADSRLALAFEAEGRPIIAEGFADRAYEADGTLRSRSLPGAVLTDTGAIKSQVLKLAGSVDSVCVHGDTEGCVEFAELVYRTLEEGGFEVGY